MGCAIITSVLGCVVTSYLFFHYTMFVELSLSVRAALYVLALIVGCIPLLVSYKLEAVMGVYYNFYRYSLYSLYVFSIIWFSYTLFLDAGFVAIMNTSLITKLKNWCCYSYVIITVLALLSAVWALHEGVKIPNVKNVKIISDKIINNQNIVVLTDLHIHRSLSENKLRDIIARTNAQNPDVVLLGGDIIDDDIDKIGDLINILAELKAKNGIYFVMGNHEFYIGYDASVDVLKKQGFIFLENSGASIGDELYVAGIPDRFSAKTHKIEVDIERAFENAKPNQYKILLSHTPEDWEEENNFDLEVSGHTHGGQIFPFHILTYFGNKYLSGLYDMKNNAKIYVSNGAGQWGPQMRFFAPSEITVINLEGTK